MDIVAMRMRGECAIQRREEAMWAGRRTWAWVSLCMGSEGEGKEGERTV
jgi:hypothetical protein